ncbi:probable serine/threonine-protein kinase PBL25 isoform X4 [Helianthus annuus]|uniref:probable serine/threonine-protein kinase PBL25 isoform X4 n=1 Tax=Helianthus annuus TaxID=4232 RepID=UPI0016533339|nr:probable serine/threonine-protein kinase PBL25 isoform X4 [Helianthus annuus]
MYMFVCICLNEFHRFRCCLFRYAEVSIQDDYVRDENVHDAYVELNQLSDFGLAKWVTPTGLQITSTNVAGTFGYLVPEYFTHGKFMEKIDVYAFGVVLLELLTGRKPISNGHPKGEESLVMWANPVLNSGKFSRLLDPILGVDYDVDQMECMALAAMLCIRRVPRARPQITIIRNRIEMYPYSLDAWSNLGSAYMRKGRLTEAAQCCRQALSLNPHLADTQLLEAYVRHTSATWRHSIYNRLLAFSILILLAFSWSLAILVGHISITRLLEWLLKLSSVISELFNPNQIMLWLMGI